MPYASLNRPSLALGLLKAVLERAGIATAAVYPNLAFAEEIGLRLYHLPSQFPKDFLAGEWTFAEAAFREAPRAGDEEYLERIAALHAMVPGYHRGADIAGPVVAEPTKPFTTSQTISICKYCTTPLDTCPDPTVA